MKNIIAALIIGGLLGYLSHAQRSASSKETFYFSHSCKDGWYQTDRDDVSVSYECYDDEQ